MCYSLLPSSLRPRQTSPLIRVLRAVARLLNGTANIILVDPMVAAYKYVPVTRARARVTLARARVTRARARASPVRQSRVLTPHTPPRASIQVQNIQRALDLIGVELQGAQGAPRRRRAPRELARARPGVLRACPRGLREHEHIDPARRLEKEHPPDRHGERPRALSRPRARQRPRVPRARGRTVRLFFVYFTPASSALPFPCFLSS